MRIETKRLLITDLTIDMVEAIQKNSLDDDNRRFVPDEVFETVEDAKDVVEYLMEQYESLDGPLLYPIIIKGTEENIGYVQIVPLEDDEWEVGYHIAKSYTGRGYATEALMAFLPKALDMLNISKVVGILLEENIASAKVLEKCGFVLEFKGLGEYQEENRNIRVYSFHK